MFFFFFFFFFKIIAVLRVEQKKNPLFVLGWDRKIHPVDHRLSSLGKPRDVNR